MCSMENTHHLFVFHFPLLTIAEKRENNSLHMYICIFLAHKCIVYAANLFSLFGRSFFFLSLNLQNLAL